MSGVIIIGPAGIAFAISLPLGLGITSDPRATPAGEVSTIGIGPPLISAPNILPGLPSSCPSRSTKNIAEPPQALFFARPLPKTATYLSLLISPSDDVGILIIFGVDQVSPSFV